MPTYLTPGPSQPYPKLRSFLNDAWDEDVVSWSHRGSQFSNIYKRTQEALCELLSVPAGYKILFVGSATEAMERVTQGLVRVESYHFVLGAFGEKWQQIADQLGKKTLGDHVKPNNWALAEKLNVPDSAELICVTLNETSVGAQMPNKQLKRLGKHPLHQLLAVDIVSAVPLIPVDWQHVDVAFFSVQKAFGLPAGLGVIIINDAALERAERLRMEGIKIGSYHSLVALADSADKLQTPETPNVLAIYLLGRVAEDMINQGIDTIRNSTKKRSSELYSAMESSNHFSPLIEDKQWRSPTVIVADMLGPNDKFLAHLNSNGLVAGKGYYPEHKETHVRIANFPSVSDESYKELIKHIKSWPKSKRSDKVI